MREGQRSKVKGQVPSPLIMDPLWLEFRSGPAAYLSSRGISNQGLVDELLQLLTTPTEKNDVAKLAALGVFQEMAPSLFTDVARLETTVTTLKTVFQQQRSTGSSLICGQILCAMTSVLIEMEDLMDTDYLLLDLVHLLFDVIEKVKSEGNLLLRSTACECLNELEMAYPGLLSSKVGHFYRMSQAENTYIFQHYLLLLATALKHTLQKYLLAMEQDHTPDFSLNDLLSHAEPLKSYTLPEDLRRQAKQIYLESPSAVLGEEVESGDMRRAVSFILDCHQLLTPSCLALTLDQVISMVSLSSLAPRMLKSLLLHYLSCQNLLPFHLALMLKWKFGEEICDEEDADSINKWLTIMACHPALPIHHRELLLSLYLHWSQGKLLSQLPRNYSEEEIGGEGDGQEGRWQQAFLPSVFDSYDTYYYKVKALKFQLETEEVLPGSPLPHLLSTVLKQVQYGIEGTPVITLFRLFYAYYSTYPHSVANSDELLKMVVKVIKDYPKFIPHTIDFITAIQRSFPDSPLPLQLLADYLQYLSTSSLPSLLPHLPLYLLFVKQAAMHSSINPLVVIHFLTRILKNLSLSEMGMWENGSTILSIANTLMRRHHTDTIFKELADLLGLVSTSYNDIDIQDRARFYHQLLLTVSGEKLSAILTLASDNATGSTLSDIVEARITDNTYPSAPPVKSIAERFLSLTRVQTQDEPYYQNEDTTGDTDTALKDYLASLDEGAHQGLSFSLQYQIQFLHLPEGVSPRIYAAVLKLSRSASYHCSPDIYIPYLACKDSEAPVTSSSKIISFTFFPKEPIPTTFRVSATFTTEEGVTCVTDLGDIEVSFEDLLHPLPTTLKVSPSDMFQLLWTDMEASQHPKSLKERFGILSTIHLDIGRTKWEQRAKRIQLLQVPNKDEVQCMVFLPPKYHLMFKLRFQDSGVSVLLATDCWRVLELINTYLHDITVD